MTTTATAPARVDLAPDGAASDQLTPIDRYLAEQADLTAVERFSQRHETGALPAQARYYRDLVPLHQPGPGQQYGFEVDLDACTGCKACVTACHSLNGLDDGESWRTVGLVEAGGTEPYQQPVTAACHHCVEPACLQGCPVNAYEKDPVTGIVVHLDDQCIGCRYCLLTCPYEVPRYNPDRGIVRKCDLCIDRLGAGEAPVCVSSCPNAAIQVTVIDTAGARVAAAIAGATLVTGAPPSAITVPTTVYRSTRAGAPQPGPSDHPVLRRGHSHPPLAVMLVLTQLAVGASVVDVAMRALAGGELVDALRPATALVALAVGLLALGASVLHLGRPVYAFRAVLGIRRSWLSREIVAFVAFAGLAAVHGWALLTGATGIESVLGLAVAGAGVVGVACSAMVYAVTHRAWWALPTTGTKFTLSAALTGAAAVLVTSMAVALVVGPAAAERAALELGRPLAALVVACAMAKLVWEASLVRHLRPGAPAELRRSAHLLVGELATSSRWRFALGALGALSALAALFAASTPAPAVVLGLGAVSFVALVAGELVERWQFFTAVAPARMPSSPG
ncbi:MAG: DmsC/YnfH family molybdoenzyme membrane anchor subunit [Acidimicrobiales bacterium]